LISAACELEFEVNFMTLLDRFSSQISGRSGDWGETGELWNKLYEVSCLRFMSLTCVSCISSGICIFQKFLGLMKIIATLFPLPPLCVFKGRNAGHSDTTPHSANLLISVVHGENSTS